VFLPELGEHGNDQTAATQFQLQVFKQIKIELGTVLHTVCNIYYALHSIVVKRKTSLFIGNPIAVLRLLYPESPISILMNAPS
jgi:hypothetical protein